MPHGHEKATVISVVQVACPNKPTYLPNLILFKLKYLTKFVIESLHFFSISEQFGFIEILRLGMIEKGGRIQTGNQYTYTNGK